MQALKQCVDGQVEHKTNHDVLPPQAPDLREGDEIEDAQHPPDPLTQIPRAQDSTQHEVQQCSPIAVHDPLSVRQALMWQVQSERPSVNGLFHHFWTHKDFNDLTTLVR